MTQCIRNEFRLLQFESEKKARNEVCLISSVEFSKYLGKIYPSKKQNRCMKLAKDLMNQNNSIGFWTINDFIDYHKTLEDKELCLILSDILQAVI